VLKPTDILTKACLKHLSKTSEKCQIVKKKRQKMSPLISNFDLPSVCEFVCMSRSGNLLLSWKLNYEQETQVMSEVQGQGGRRLRSVRAGGGGDGAFR